MSLVPVKMKGNGLGLDILEVDGIDFMKGCYDVKVECEAAKPTQIHLSVRGAVDIETEAIVVVHDQISDDEIRKSVGRWITSIDSEQVEAMALARMGQADSFTGRVLEVLAEMAGVGSESN